MNDKFDELAKAMAQPVARRTALKKFGVGAAVVLLTAIGLAPRADATPSGSLIPCKKDKDCRPGMKCKQITDTIRLCVPRWAEA
jgi:hypothetical protein